MKELTLTAIDGLIETHEKNADYYKNEGRFAENEEKWAYQELRNTHNAFVHDLKRLRKVVEDASRSN